MLLRLEPDQIASYWGLLLEGAEASIPPIVPNRSDRANVILQNALEGKLQVWLAYDRVEGGVKVYGMVITAVDFERFEMERFLTIYGLYVFRPTPGRIWLESLRNLREFAKSHDCRYIVGYTYSDNVVGIVEKLGGEVSCRFIRMEV